MALMDLIGVELPADYKNPLGLLRRTHTRITQHLDLALAALELSEQSGATDETTRALRTVHTYFTHEVRLHQQDEEQDFFPRLIRTSLKIADRVHKLKQQHQELNRFWQNLGKPLSRPESIADLSSFLADFKQFATLKREHLDYEEREFLQLAQHLLSTEQLKQLGDSMHERRKSSPR